MGTEHVEDTLIEKRVVVHDEHAHVSEYLLRQGRGVQQDPEEMYPDSDIDRIVPLLRRIGEINQRRRSYLLLKDWSYKRPW